MTDNQGTLPEHAFLDDLRRKLRRALDFRLVEIGEIDAGAVHNNRLLWVLAEDGRRAVVKRYFRDDRRRLEREYGALTFLRKRGFSTVPEPYFRDDDRGYAVYSFEDGAPRLGAELTTANLREIGRFAAELSRVWPGESGADFPTAFPATFSLGEMVGFIRARLKRFSEFARGSDAYEPVQALVAELDVVATVEGLIGAATAGLSADELMERLPEGDWRLTTGDFAPHNVLVRPDGRICVVDFEYAGWDDPAALSATFIVADTACDLSPEKIEAFLSTFRAASDLPDRVFVRFERVRVLMEISAIVGSLALLTPARIAPKRFASDRFDLDAHLAEQIARFRRRLVRAQTSIQTLMPD